jgi:DNA-binding GntR family transcriptional regulator
MPKSIIQTKSKNEQVYEYLHTQILHGALPPGSRLIIDQIAKQLGVSQIPIREAIFRLESDGFVTFETHVGAKVSEIRAREIREVFQVLEAMEVISGRAACALIGKDEIKWLENLTKDMARVTGDPNQWSLHNKEFHQYICDIAEAGLVKKVLREALDHWDRLRHYYLREVSARRVKEAQHEHEQLIKALKKGDADQFEAIIRKHNQESLQAYLNHLEAKGALDAR